MPYHVSAVSLFVKCKVLSIQEAIVFVNARMKQTGNDFGKNGTLTFGWALVLGRSDEIKH